MYTLLTGTRGKTLLKESLQLESYNGTSLKPSFTYVEIALAPNFLFKSFSEAKLQVTQARQLADIVVYGTPKTFETLGGKGGNYMGESSVTITTSPSDADEINLSDIPF